MLEGELKVLSQQLQQLCAADRKLRVFGAKKHRYQLQPTLSEQEISGFERARGCRLPEDYRAFLGCIGNGGTGPYYGLNPLQEASVERDLSQPFPFTKATDFYGDDNGDENYEPQINAYDNFPGIIELCDMGCATYCYLVVNGPAYGTVWYNDEDFHPVSAINFLSWYQQWIERKLLLLNNQILSRQLKIGMSKAHVREVLGGDWSERQSMIEPKTILSSGQFPFTVEFATTEKLIAIKNWPFI